MKIDELMIGNWFYRYCCNDQVMEVRAGGVIGLDSSRGIINLYEMQPIPITIEWLVKNGFEKRREEICDYYCYSKEIEDGLYKILIQCSDSDERFFTLYFNNNKCQTSGYADIQYIHQLQNLLNIINIKEEFIV